MSFVAVVIDMLSNQLPITGLLMMFMLGKKNLAAAVEEPTYGLL